MQLFSGDTPLFLAPMAGVTDYAFRTVCAQHGADVTVTEMVSSRALVYQDRKSRGLLRRNEGSLCGAQIFGNDPAMMAEAAQIAVGAVQEFLREKKWKKMKKDQWLILFLAGVLLLVVAMPAGKSSSKTIKQQNTQTEIAQTNGTESGESDYEKTLETRLAQILQGMDGVGKVQVMITFQDQGESVVEKDVTMRQDAATGSSGQDSAGGTAGSLGGGSSGSGSRESSESTVFSQLDRDETPFVNKEILPKIDGVLIVAEGGADAGVRKNISEAVEALFGLDAHKIKIVLMNSTCNRKKYMLICIRT